jgi:hypothetical protein
VDRYASLPFVSHGVLNSAANRRRHIAYVEVQAEIDVWSGREE